MTKPFGMVELEARLWVALGRSLDGAADSPSTVCVVALELTSSITWPVSAGRTSSSPAGSSTSSPTSPRHAGRVRTHQMVLRDVWGSA
ncbi:MAG: hypothetical protein ACYCZP_02975 [Acidimicrobiales bacterium]